MKDVIRDKSEVKYYYDLINEMIDSGKYDRSEDFLFSLGEWIEENKVITEKQINRIIEIREEY